MDRLGLSAAGRLWLKPFDFGIELLTAQQIERNRQKVEYKLSQMVGWGGTEQEGSPLWFLNQCKRMVELSETNQRRDGNKKPTQRGGNTKGNNGDNDTKPEQKRNQAKIDDDDNTEDNSSGDRSVLQNSWPGGTWITGVRIFHFLWFTLFVNISIYHFMYSLIFGAYLTYVFFSFHYMYCLYRHQELGKLSSVKFVTNTCARMVY